MSNIYFIKKMPRCKILGCRCPAFKGYDMVVFQPWNWDICRDCNHHKNDHY